MKRTEVPIALEKPDDDGLYVEVGQWDGDGPGATLSVSGGVFSVDVKLTPDQCRELAKRLLDLTGR